MNEHLAHLKPIGETLSFASLIGYILGWLPAIATLLTIIWYCVLFYDRFRSKRQDRSGDGTHY